MKNLLLHERVKASPIPLAYALHSAGKRSWHLSYQMFCPPTDKDCALPFDRRIVYIAKSFHAQWAWRHSLAPLSDNYPHREGK